MRHLWDQMELGEVIGKLCRSRRYKFNVAETAFVLVANRLCDPHSEHGLTRWLEHTFMCDAKGSRDARRVVSVLGIAERNPPRSQASASKPPETAM